MGLEGLRELKPALMMMAVQLISTALNVFYKLAANDGMSLKIIIAYRFIFSTLFILPIAFFVERGTRPKLTWMTLFYAFLCGLFGGLLLQNLFIESLHLTSTMFASAMGNLLPAITFMFAVILRLEEFNIRSPSGKAKLLGSVVSVGGAMFLTLYKGIQINIWSTHIDLLKLSSQHHHNHVASPKDEYGNRILGCLLSVGSCLSYSVWLIIQSKMSKAYPCCYSSTALMSIMALIQTLVYAICMERNLNQWKLGWDIRLLTVAFSGIVGSGVMGTLIAWCVHMRGPVFVSLFSPLSLVMVTIVGSLVLEEKLYLGSVLGLVLIVFGLYMVLWGKGKEMKNKVEVALPHSLGDQPESLHIDVLSPTVDNKKTSSTNNANIKE